MALMYHRPAVPVPLSADPQLPSWDRAGHPSQVRLAGFLAHVDAVAAPLISPVDSPLAVELIVGLPAEASLTGGGRDLDNYLYPVAQRIGPTRIAAMFGRKTRGSSALGIGPARPRPAPPEPRFSTRISGSYERREWKTTLRERLRHVHDAAPATGPVEMDIAVTTAPGRNWANLWKPLIDAFGPVLGEDPDLAFHPHDDRIISLGLHHHVSTDIGHDVTVEARWASGCAPFCRGQLWCSPAPVRAVIE